MEAIERNYALADDMARTLTAPPGDSGSVEGESNDRLCGIAARSRNLLQDIFRCPFPSSDKLEAVGAHLSEFWTLKRALAKGSEPQYVTDIFAALAPHCHGMVSADTSISSS